jgi:hypothetical protein
MCLIVSVELPTQTPKFLAEIASELSQLSPLDVHVARGRRPRLTLSERNQGCACSMLADDADWNAATWAMRPQSTATIAETLAAIGKVARGPLVFQAVWIGDKTEDEEHIALKDLLGVVKRSGIRTKVRYVVS